MKISSLSLIAVPVLLLLSADHALASADPKQEAIDLLVRNKPADACAVLDKSFDAGNMEEAILFLRARCKRDLKEYDASLEYYKKLAAVSPQSYQAHIELADAYMRSGHKQDADDEYNRVLAMKAPPAIKRRARNGLNNKLPISKHWYLRLEGGAVYDTNINAGPAGDQVVIFGAPVVLPSSNMEKDSMGYSLQADAAYLHPFNARTGMLARASVNAMNYTEDSDFNLNTYRFDIGPVYNKGRSSTSFLFNGLWRTLGGDTYNTSLGATLRSTYRLDDRFAVGGSVAGMTTDYPDVIGREGSVASFSPDVTYAFSPTFSASAAGIIRWDDAESDIYQNEALGYNLGLSKDLTTSVRSNIGFQYVKSNYSGAQLAFANTTREDDQYVGNARIDWDISPYTWQKTSIGLKYQYINNDSNIPLYSFNRHITMLTVSKSW